MAKVTTRKPYEFTTPPEPVLEQYIDPDLIPQPLPYDYMPDGYPRIDQKPVTIFDQTVEGFAEGGGAYGVRLTGNVFELVAGEKYTVVFDGVKYPELVCNEQKEGVTFIGADSGGEMSEKLPFTIIVKEGEDGEDGKCTIITISTEPSHAISIARISEVVTPMDSRFVSGGGVKYCTIDTNDGETFFSTMTYQEIAEAMMNGSLVVGVSRGRLFYVTEATFLSAVATFDLIEHVIFEHHSDGLGIQFMITIVGEVIYKELTA